MFLCIFTSLLIYSNSVQSTRPIPSYVNLCKRTDPNLNECVKKSALELLPRLKDGAPELFLPSFNPYRMPEVQLKSSDFQIVFRNVELYTDKLPNIDTLKIEFENDPHIHMTITIPNIRIIADYESSGKLLLLELNGNGKSDGNFTNVHLEVTSSGKIRNKKGKEYLEINENFEQLDLELEGGSLYFNNIAGENEQLNDIINTTLNENIQALLEEFKPLLKSVISAVAHSVFKKFFDTFNLNDLFPV